MTPDRFSSHNPGDVRTVAAGVVDLYLRLLASGDSPAEIRAVLEDAVEELADLGRRSGDAGVAQRLAGVRATAASYLLAARDLEAAGAAAVRRAELFRRGGLEASEELRLIVLHGLRQRAVAG